MITTPEKLAATHKTAVDSVLQTVQTVFDSSERLIALNLNTARALLGEGTTNAKVLMNAKNPDELVSLQASMVQPGVEEAIDYYRNYYEIVAQCLEDAVKPFERQFGELNKLFAAELEKAAKSAPVGSDVALEVVKSSIAAANSSYDQVTKATRQAVEIAEANVAAATDVAVKAVGNTAGAAARKKSA